MSAGKALVATAAQVAAAEAAAEQARADRAQAQRDAHHERTRRHTAVWQDWAKSYDHRALTAAANAAGAKLREALAATDLGTALVDYIAAVMRVDASRGLAAEALTHGATLPAPLTTTATTLTVTGEPVGFVLQQLGSAVVEVAHRTVEAEADSVRTAAQTAADAVYVLPPTAYEVRLASGGDLTDQVGAHQAVVFRAGVATVRVEDLGHEQVESLLRYWRSLPDTYSVSPVW